MRTLKTIHTLSCHAEGEVGDVIIDGVEVPPGRTVGEMRDFIEADGRLRSFMVNEPRGGVSGTSTCWCRRPIPMPMPASSSWSRNIPR